MPEERESILEAFAAEAIRLGADELEIEYKDRNERIFAFKNGFGFGIGSLPSSEPDAIALHNELWAMKRRKRVIVVDEIHVELRATTFDSFGETAFRAKLRPGDKTGCK